MSKKCKNNTKFNVQPCHCEQSSAIHISSPLGTRGSQRGLEMQTLHHPQSGRSMVEMLGTLAIVGVLSAGAIGGYSYAMNKHRTNELIYEATKRAQWVGTQLEMNNPNPSLNTFGTDSFGGGRFTGEVLQLENGQIGIKVAGLKEAVCQNILNSIADNTVIREMRDVNCNDDNGTATLIFNRDLGTDDPAISESAPEASGEVVGTTPEATETATQNPDDIHCSGNGSWNGSSCYCDNGWQGDNCSEEEPESSETATGGYEPEETTTGTNQSGESGADSCNGHGTWIVSTAGANGGLCSCDNGYYGPDCSQEGAVSCDDNNNCSAGYFCLYDSSSNVSCTSGPSGQGKCVKVSGYRGGSGNGFTWSTTGMDWFSAENFCAAQNKDMPTIDSFECYQNGTSRVIRANTTDSGCCCKANGTTCNYDDWAAGGETRSSKFASKIVSLKNAFGGDRIFWTQSLTNNSCYAFRVDLDYGYVDLNDRAHGRYALCW